MELLLEYVLNYQIDSDRGCRHEEASRCRPEPLLPTFIVLVLLLPFQRPYLFCRHDLGILPTARPQTS